MNYSMSQEQLYRLIALLQIFGDTYKVDTTSMQLVVKDEVKKLENELDRKDKGLKLIKD